MNHLRHGQDENITKEDNITKCVRYLSRKKGNR